MSTIRLFNKKDQALLAILGEIGNQLENLDFDLREA